MAEHAQDGSQPQPDPVAQVTSGLKANLPQFALLAQATQPRPYEPPTAALRSETKSAIQQRAVEDLARLRFAFPIPKYPDYKTYVNQPQRSIGVQMPNGLVAYPDIVVVQHPENYTKILAVVESSETVVEDVARHEWLPYAKLAPLYLYVPVGKADEAKALTNRFKIPVVGIRTWRYVLGYNELEITETFNQWTGPEDLLPPPLRGIAKQFL